MAQNPEHKQPTIIKKIQAEEEHPRHSGAWKVAYADFVTAMMAFFLLLWLLNSTPSSKLKGIAQFFEPTIGIIGRSGAHDGSQQCSHETEVDSEGSSVKGIVYGVKRVGEVVELSKDGTPVTATEAEDTRFEVIKAELTKEIARDAQLSQYQGNVSFEQTPEGLVIKIADQNDRPMFERNSAKLTPQAEVILNKIVKLIQFAPNFISISGYTEKASESLFTDYSNWELSADRANYARRQMLKEGLSPERIAKVIAFADASPADPTAPSAPQNRRISIMLLRNSVMPFYKLSTPGDFLPNAAK